MKIKLVVIDLELSARAKRIAAAVLVPALVLGGGAVAYAKVQHTWADGDTLSAADLNGNFNALDQRVTMVEQAAPAVTAAIAALQKPISARYRISVPQVLPGGAFPPPETVVNYDMKVYDTANAVTTGSSWHFTAPISGRYLVTSSLGANECSACNNSSAYASFRLFVNGASSNLPLDQRYDWVGGNMYLSGSEVLELAAGDAVDLRFGENSLSSTVGNGGVITITRLSD